jgi:hypothetical protein
MSWRIKLFTVGLFLFAVGWSCSPAVETVLVGINPNQAKRDSACTCATTAPGSTTTVPSGSTTTPPTTTTTVAPPPIVVDTLPVAPPRFVPNGGTVKLGTAVKVVADAVPNNGIIEYSVDKGQTWLAASQFALMDGGPLLSRETLFAVYFERMLVIGNSIMEHAPLPEVGWKNNNGMAASAPDNDFVHILTRRLQTLWPSTTVRLQFGGDFERMFWQYDLNNLNDALSNKPDLIVVRIAENVDQDLGDLRNFEKYYRALIDHLAANAAPVHKIVCSTSFWNQPRTDAIIQKVAAEKGYPVACLCGLVDRPQFQALQYINPGVAKHPNDAGMAQIAELLWDKIQ